MYLNKKFNVDIILELVESSERCQLKVNIASRLIGSCACKNIELTRMAGLLYYKQSKVCGLIPSLAEERNKFKKESWSIIIKYSTEILTHNVFKQKI